MSEDKINKNSDSNTRFLLNRKLLKVVNKSSFYKHNIETCKSLISYKEVLCLFNIIKYINKVKHSSYFNDLFYKNINTKEYNSVFIKYNNDSDYKLIPYVSYNELFNQLQKNLFKGFVIKNVVNISNKINKENKEYNKCIYYYNIKFFLNQAIVNKIKFIFNFIKNLSLSLNIEK